MNSLKYYVVGGIMALASFFGIVSYNADNPSFKEATDSLIETILGGPEKGTPEWFTSKEQQYKRLVDQIKDVKYTLQNTVDWNEQTNIRFTLNTVKNACAEVSSEYNTVAAEKSVPTLDANLCN